MGESGVGMNVEDEIDKILTPLLYIGGGLDDYGAPTEAEIKTDPVFKEAKARLIVLIDHGGLETSSDEK